MEIDERHELTIWIAENLAGDAKEFARRIDATYQSVCRYQRGRMPRQPFLDRIVIVTGGAVTADAWLGKEAADVVARRDLAA